MSKILLDELINISEKKLVLLKNILQYTINQKQSILDDNIDDLEKIISKKQNEIDIINKIDILFNDKFVELKKINNISNLEEINKDYYTHVKALKNVISKIELLLADIYKLENENNVNIKKNFSEVKEKLRNIRQSKKAANKYNAYKNNNESIFIDSKK